LLDVLAAGGQPSGLTFRENAFKEAEEEASIPRGLLEGLSPGGMISYRWVGPGGGREGGRGGRDGEGVGIK
jgi:hypothetical protein